jgi:hypothetical protein
MVMWIVIGYLALCVISSHVYVCVSILGSRADDRIEADDWGYPVLPRKLTPAASQRALQSLTPRSTTSIAPLVLAANSPAAVHRE